MSTGPTCNGSLFLTGLVLWSVVLADLQAQSAAAPRMALSPPLPPLPVIQTLPASAGTNQAARLPAKIPTIPLPQAGSLLAATNRAVGPAPGTTSVPNAAPVRKSQLSRLVCDAEVKEYHARPGETNAQFTFTLTNTGPTEIVINDVRTSCGCVVATLPEYPWRLASGTNGHVQVIADLRGQRGLLHKVVYVHTANYRMQTLAINVHVPDAMPGVMGGRAPQPGNCHGGSAGGDQERVRQVPR